MAVELGTEPYRLHATHSGPSRFRPFLSSLWFARTPEHSQPVLSTEFFVQLTAVFLAYFVAGKLGQATSNIRSSNLGPVWPAYGIALSAFLAYGYRVWPAVAASAFLVAAQGSVPPLAAAGQTIGATVGSATGAFLLRRIGHFDPSLTRLRDALGLIVLGAFGSALVSSSIGVFSLYATGIQPYSGVPSAWLVYWLGDSTGVLLVTPLVFTLPGLFEIRSRIRIAELAALLALLTGACVVVFGDVPLVPIRLHVLAFGVLPFVMWGAIKFGIGGASLSVFLIATMATVLTALGSGPFAGNTPFISAVLLDVLFTVFAVSGLALAAVIAERERAESERANLIREQTAIEARLRLAAIVESSDDAIVSEDLDGVIVSWNVAAHRIFGFTAADAIGQPVSTLILPLAKEGDKIRRRLKAGERMVHFETVLATKAGKNVDVSVTTSPLADAAGRLVGAATIVRDISPHKQAEEALSSVSRRLIEAQEQERSRIARELHDDISQRLGLLAWRLNGLAQAPPDSAAGLRQGIEDAREEAVHLGNDIQGLSYRLHPPRLELVGLAAAAAGLCGELSNRQNVKIDFHAESIPNDLSQQVSLCLFRVLQEALQNATKHSGARHAQVLLKGGATDIELTVHDAGIGFVPEEATKGRGLGLTSMKERLRGVGGQLSVDSKPQHGTTVHARVPLVDE
jgi:PAS domain S-box-containing protein